MKKNNFFIMTVLGALFGINQQMYSSEGLIASVVMGSVAVVTVVKTIKNSATYKTYSEHTNKCAQEKDASDNPLLYAQELPKQNFGNYAEEKTNIFEENYKKQQQAYNKRLEPVVIKCGSFEIIDNYRDEK